MGHLKGSKSGSEGTWGKVAPGRAPRGRTECRRFLADAGQNAQTRRVAAAGSSAFEPAQLSVVLTQDIWDEEAGVEIF